MSKNLQVSITKLHNKVVAVTMIDDEHRIAKVLWQASKPLSDEEILHIYSESYRNTLMGIDPLAFAKAIEKAHGIE
jgi:hypothetical protein